MKVQNLRLFASLAAVIVGVLICLHQRHFTVSLADPASFVRMLRHKCGIVMAAAALWSASEIAGWAVEMRGGRKRGWMVRQLRASAL